MCKVIDLLVFILLGFCSFHDWRKRTIPVYLLIIISVTVVVSAIMCEGQGLRLRITGALIGMLFLFISKCTKEAIGYGDSWLIMVLGIHLGSLRAIGVLFVSSMLAGIVALLLLWRCRWKRSVTLPFVPFLTISYLGVLLL